MAICNIVILITFYLLCGRQSVRWPSDGHRLKTRVPTYKGTIKFYRHDRNVIIIITYT